MFHILTVFYFGTESKQSTEQSESLNPDIIDIHADVDDNWLIEAAEMAEANLILKTTETTIGESTSGN